MGVMKVDAALMVKNLPLALTKLPPVAVPVPDDDTDSTIPQELRSWLVRLRLLEGVPFAHLGAQYPAIRDELDQEERNYRRQPGTPRFGGKVDAVSGFILRSQAVSGWPGLHVRAFTVDPTESDDASYPDDDPRRMRLLRLERLAPAVLFCMFDGIPEVVHIEEPRQGVQFGFDMTAVGASSKAQLQPRNRTTFKDLNVPKIDVPFRAGTGSSGVVDIEALEKLLAKHGETGA